MVAQGVVIAMAMHIGAGAFSRKRVDDNFGDPCLGAVGHQKDAVGQEHRLVDIMGDHEGGLAGLCADIEKLVLK